jgi:Tol biopolymer transport system component
MRLIRRPVRFAALLFAAGLIAPAAHAQYFGRNKIQYQSFKFEVLQTPHFDIYFYPEEQAAVQFAARSAERWYARHSRVLKHQLRGRQPMILYASSPAFQQTNAIMGELGEGTGGVTEPLRRRIVLPVGGPLREMDHVIGHELVHAFQFDITGPAPTGAAGALPAATGLPLWFIEGMAEFLSLGPADPFTAMWMRDAAQHHLPSYKELDDPRYFPYRYGQALLAFIAGRYGDESIGALLRVAGQTRSVDAAIRQVLGVTPDVLVRLWHEATRDTYAPVVAATVAPGAIGRLLAGPRGEEAQYNVSPALSPDGRWLMFLSNRGLFSIDLYLADAATGKIVRRVTSTAVDAHFQSLQFINSAGAWAPDSRRFAFASIVDGRPVLVVYDARADRREAEIRFSDLGEILNPTWAPDGRSIAFSAVVGGLTDLFVYDLEAKRLRRLTNDAFADLEPDWSPDGRTLAFVTDRFSTNLDRVAPGPYQLGLLDLESGRITPAGFTLPGNQLNPQWGPGGRSLFFIADPDGISNLYRFDLGGAPVRLTNLYTGAAGITATSPALSVAGATGAIVFSAFENNAYGVYALQPALAAAQTALPGPPPGSEAGLLPPQDRVDHQLLDLLRDPQFGLPADTAYAVRPYQPRLGLEFLGQPTLAVGTDAFGTYVGGGTALFFRDILGNHNLVTAFQASGGVNDIAALVAYQNLAHRLNWGVAVQQQPYRTGAFFAGPAVLDGDTVFVEQALLQRQVNREADLVLSYPFSTVQRVEFQAGYLNIGFQNELRTQAFSLLTGDLVLDSTVSLPAPNALNLATGSLALVYDNSIFGATGPVLGRRYRFEFAPAAGSLTFFNALGDVRAYLMPVRPFTFAFRALHFGRYGKDGDDPRFTPLFLGYDGLVRGYSYGSFDPSECVPTAANPNACPVFDQLLGSRILVGNAELRFPLFGLLGIGHGYYGAFPLELALFGDAGVAWDKTVKPTFFGGTRKPVYSTGAAIRANVFGLLIAEVDLVHPFDRPQRDWVWQFSLLPAF